jgi:hypothetical protein
MRHLDLASEICAVDDVTRMILAGDKGHRATQIQIHADPDFAIVQERHPGANFSTNRCSSDWEENPKHNPEASNYFHNRMHL